MNALKKLLESVLILVFCLWPLWLYLCVHATLSPEGFWQKFIVLGLGVYFLGFAQVFFFGLAIFFLVAIWSD